MVLVCNSISYYYCKGDKMKKEIENRGFEEFKCTNCGRGSGNMYTLKDGTRVCRRCGYREKRVR